MDQYSSVWLILKLYKIPISPKARTKRTCTTSENGKVGGKDGQSREKNGEKIEMEKIINKGKKREVRI